MASEKAGEILKKPWITACIVTLLCILLASFRPLYMDGDNYEIALVANKIYGGETQDGYIMHFHPILCGILELVGNIRSADCFTLTALVMLFAGVWVCTYLIAEHKSAWFERLLFCGVLFATVTVGDLFHDNYTRWAAFLTAVGLMELLVMIHQKIYNRKKAVLAAILLGCGMMWRDEAFLVFIPYIVFDIFMVFISAQKENRKNILKILGSILLLPVLCIGILGITDSYVKNSEKYRESIAYDKARVSVVDYPMKSWEEVKDDFSDVSENDYNSVNGWFLIDTEQINEAYLLKISEIGRERPFEINAQGIIEMQKTVLEVFNSNLGMQYLSSILILLFLFSMLSGFSWYHKLEIVCLYLGTDLIFLYFAYAGRAIDRSFIPGAYALLACMGVLYLTEAQLEKKSDRMMKSILLCAIVCSYLNAEITEGSWTQGQSVFEVHENILNGYPQYCDGDNLYIWDLYVHCEYIMEYFALQGKLIPQELLSHHISEGSWIYGQVYFNEFLEERNAKNPARALLEREHTYYMARDCSNVLTYLKEHYHENVTATCIGEIENMPIWVFSVLE